MDTNEPLDLSPLLPRCADTEIYTPSEISERDYEIQHRTIFNANAFDIDNNGNVLKVRTLPKDKRKSLTRDNWLRIVDLLSKWKDIEALSPDEAEEYACYVA
jgi:hypothetical protein